MAKRRDRIPLLDRTVIVEQNYLETALTYWIDNLNQTLEREPCAS